jgi:hypothetical protein
MGTIATARQILSALQRQSAAASGATTRAKAERSGRRSGSAGEFFFF